MNKMKSMLMLFVLSAAVVSAGCDSEREPEKGGGTAGTFRLEYDFGESTSGANNIYVIWAENGAENFYYPLYICNRLFGIGGSLTNTALPYWKVNKYPNMMESDVDAVTGATVRQTDFTVLFNLPDGAPRQFTVYFETDVSFNANDWFSDQPAILYQADIDLDNPESEYVLEFTGWTPNEGTEGVVAGADFGELQNETRYITNLKGAGDSFGEDDPDSQTSLVGVNGIRIIIE